jgi:hypothetical protein
MEKNKYRIENMEKKLYRIGNIEKTKYRQLNNIEKRVQKKRRADKKCCFSACLH